MKYSSLTKRFIAFTLDSFLATLIYLIGALITFLPLIFILGDSIKPEERETVPVISMIGMGVILFSLVFFAMYYVYVWYPYKHKGQTIGKRMMNMQVVKSNGTLLSLGEYVLRFLLLYVVYGFTWIMILVDEHNRGIHDYVFDTRVVDTLINVNNDLNQI